MSRNPRYQPPSDEQRLAMIWERRRLFFWTVRQSVFTVFACLLLVDLAIGVLTRSVQAEGADLMRVCQLLGM